MLSNRIIEGSIDGTNKLRRLPSGRAMPAGVWAAHEGIARRSTECKCGYIDLKGRYVWAGEP
jgi:hypothetical protein